MSACVRCGHDTPPDDVVMTLFTDRCLCLGCVQQRLDALEPEARERARWALALLARAGRAGTGKE